MLSQMAEYTEKRHNTSLKCLGHFKRLEVRWDATHCIEMCEHCNLDLPMSDGLAIREHIRHDSILSARDISTARVKAKKKGFVKGRTEEMFAVLSKGV